MIKKRHVIARLLALDRQKIEESVAIAAVAASKAATIVVVLVEVANTAPMAGVAEAEENANEDEGVIGEDEENEIDGELKRGLDGGTINDANDYDACVGNS